MEFGIAGRWSRRSAQQKTPISMGRRSPRHWRRLRVSSGREPRFPRRQQANRHRLRWNFSSSEWLCGPGAGLGALRRHDRYRGTADGQGGARRGAAETVSAPVSGDAGCHSSLTIADDRGRLQFADRKNRSDSSSSHPTSCSVHRGNNTPKPRARAAVACGSSLVSRRRRPSAAMAARWRRSAVRQ